MLYHVSSRGNAKQAIFTDDTDYRRFLDLLAIMTRRFRVRCPSYCLIWNHVHLLLQPYDFTISRLMQQLNSAYCQWFNQRHRRVGHVLQGRFKASMVDSHVYFLRALRYIVRNPVEAGRVRHPADWAWSSYRATAGLEPAPEFLDVDRVWRALDADPGRARQQFAAFAESRADDDLPDGSFVIGSAAFARRFAPMLRRHRDNVDFVRAERFAARPPLRELFPETNSGAAFDLAARRAFCEHAYTLREISAHVGRPQATVWSRIQRAAAAGADEAGVRSRSSERPDRVATAQSKRP